VSTHTLAIIWRVFAITAIAITGAVIAFANVSGLMPVQEYDAYFHFAAFAGITLLAVTAFPRVPLSHMLVGLALLGGVTELLQFTPGLKRQPDWADFGFNVLGIGAMLLVVAVVRRFMGRSSGDRDAGQLG
jgi:peptidoglycan/LPS O-acetylase OafA/YrhL